MHAFMCWSCHGLKNGKKQPRKNTNHKSHTRSPDIYVLFDMEGRHANPSSALWVYLPRPILIVRIKHERQFRAKESLKEISERQKYRHRALRFKIAISTVETTHIEIQEKLVR
jgi:hypothetical protein